ncbi:transcription antitermination factor NusB [Candidatus Binatia bacterium]|nr:transcription antitermination factor NusB [Candidatus Binatia bacterium]
MGPRRKGRELAVQALYQLDVLGTASAPQTLRAFWEGSDASAAAKAFGMELVAGVGAERERIDELIAATSEHWRIERLSLVDVCVLRLATYELLQSPSVPTRVVLDEAIEIARRFGNAESAAFVNGVLDAIATRLGVKDEANRSGDVS